MSLDVYLISTEKVARKSSGIFIRDNGQTREVSIEEWNQINPNRNIEIIEESEIETDHVFEQNITHNLGKMALEAGIYTHIWRPDDLNFTKARALIKPLEVGLKKLKDHPDWFKQFNPSNGWGNYEVLVEFVEKYLTACKEYPKTNIGISR